MTIPLRAALVSLLVNASLSAALVVVIGAMWRM
jgi:hypothetical protein